MVANLAGDVVLSPLNGDPRPLEEWLTTFHLVSVVLDPYTNESSWVLPTAQRVLAAFRGASVRVNFVVTCGADDAKAFLGPLAEEFLVFCDPDRIFVRALGVATLPAFTFVQLDGGLAAVAQGWNPTEWRKVAAEVAKTTMWTTPAIPAAGDPMAFAGTPALG